MCSNCECNASVPSESEQLPFRIENVNWSQWEELPIGTVITNQDYWRNNGSGLMLAMHSVGDTANIPGCFRRRPVTGWVDSLEFSSPREVDVPALCPEAQQWWNDRPEAPTGFRYLELTETVQQGDEWVKRDGTIEQVCRSAIGGIVWREISQCDWRSEETFSLSAIVRPIVSEVEPPTPVQGFLPTTDTPPDTPIVDDKSRLDHVCDVEYMAYDADGKRVTIRVNTLLAEKYPNGYGLSEDGRIYEIGYTGKQKTIAFDHLLRNILKIDRWSTAGGRIVERLFDSVKWTVLTADGEALHDVFESYRPGSCMSYEKCRHLREIYAQNPQSVRVVYMRKTDNPLAESDCSALYWIGNKRIYLDRMYSSGSIDNKRTLDVLADHLETLHKMPCVYIYGGGTVKRGEYTPDITFKLNNPGTPLPYIDSLCFVKKYDSQHVWLTSKSCDVCAQNTQGTWPDGRQGTRCCDCGECGDSDDMTQDDDGGWYCSDCWSDRQSHCQWSEESYPSDQVSEVRVYARPTAYQQRRGIGELCWRYLEISQDQLDSDFIEASNGQGYIHNDCYVETNRGDIVPNDCDSGDYVITEDGEIYHPDDTVQVEDGRIYPADQCIEVDDVWYVIGEEPEAEETETEETEVQ